MVKKYTAMNVEDGSGDAIARGTARIDTAKKILRNGWTDGLVRDHRLTDDYKRDMANDFGKERNVGEEYLLDQLEEGPDPRRVWVEKMKDGRQTLIFYWSFQEYKAELNTSKVRFDFGDEY